MEKNDDRESALITDLSRMLGIQLSEQPTYARLETILADHINGLINNDFGKLVRVLYTVDVSEKELKENLSNKQKDAGTVIAQMIIERQLRKIKTRQGFKPGDHIPESEKW